MDEYERFKSDRLMGIGDKRMRINVRAARAEERASLAKGGSAPKGVWARLGKRRGLVVTCVRCGKVIEVGADVADSPGGALVAVTCEHCGHEAEFRLLA